MSRKNIISFLVASEIMFLGIDVFFIISSLIFNIANGLIFGILILMLSVGESALGLGLCITSLKLTKNIGFYDYTALKC
jgi:NADH:ubiquinone oxidoreductase subunit K